MGITVTWDTPEWHAIRYDFEPEWAWADLVAASREDDAMVADHDHFHLILDMRNIKGMPPNPTIKMQELAQNIGASAQLGLIVMVGQNRWAQSVLDVFYRVYGSHTAGIAGIEVVGTLEEARASIAEYEAAHV